LNTSPASAYAETWLKFNPFCQGAGLRVISEAVPKTINVMKVMD